MILLDKNEYYKVKDHLNDITFNNLFARSIIDQNVKGIVYVDNAVIPVTFYIRHPYGLSLLYGNTENQEFNKWFTGYALNVEKVRTKPDWMQVFPDTWNNKIIQLLPGKILKVTDCNISEATGKVEIHNRVNFRFNREKYTRYNFKNLGNEFSIKPINKELFDVMQGTVIPRYFWDTAEDFLKYGTGFSLFYQDKLVSTAFCAFIHDNKFEIGIETSESFRGKGFAQYCCSELINY
ncbi:MAG: GNAT family N-acetyltransferase [Bacteroidales bacterium]|nr:GNAT family N-acetyltransferase [Bacteroidales bacterium]